MSVSDPGKKIEWGAGSEPRKNERVPSSGTVVHMCTLKSTCEATLPATLQQMGETTMTCSILFGSLSFTEDEMDTEDRP